MRALVLAMQRVNRTDTTYRTYRTYGLGRVGRLRKLKGEPAQVRVITGHVGSALNDAISISSDARDESGGAHDYRISVVAPIHPGDPHSKLLSYQAHIHFQRGPLLEAGHNGISDEALIAIVIDRLEGFQSGPYRGRENALAITKLEECLHWLRHRTDSRRQRGVEGTSKV